MLNLKRAGAVLASVLLTGACATASPAAPTAAPTTAAAPAVPKQALAVRYGGISQASTGAVLIDYIKKHEIDKKYGIDLQYTRFNNGTQLYDAFKGGALDIVQGGTESAASMATSGVPLVAMRPFTKLSGFGFLVRADSPYHSLADLKGKKVGGETLSGTSYFSTFFAFQTAGLDLTKDVEFTNLPRQALITALDRGDLEGIQSTIPNLFQLTETGKFRQLADYSQLYQDKYGRPFFHLSQIANKSFYDANKATLWNLTKVFDEAAAASVDDWVDAGMHAPDGNDYGVSADDMRRSLEIGKPAVITSKTTAETIQQLQAFYDDLYSIKAIEKPAKASDFWALEP